MKKLTLITLLVFSSVLCFGQVKLANSVVKQIANGDTIISQMFNGYDTWDGSNPILVNYYDSIAFVGSRGVGIGTLKVFNNLAIGNGNDTLFFNNDTITGITPLDSATGNLANSSIFMDTVFTSRLLGARLGLNTLTTNSKFDVFSTAALGNNLFVFGNKDVNKSYSSWANSIDSCAFYGTSTNTGKLTIGLVDHAGVTQLSNDTNFYFRFGPSIYYGREGSLYNTHPAKFYTSTVYGVVITSGMTNGTASGATLTLIQNDGSTAVTGGTRCSYIRFGGNYNNANGTIIGASIAAYGEGTTAWSGTTDHGMNLRFYTNYDGDGQTNPVERFRITGAGGEAWTPVSQDAITDAGGITGAMLSRILYYTTAAARDISANPQIADGVNGQFLTIVGSSDVNTLKLDDGNGLQLAGAVSFTIGSGDVITLMYSSGLDLWIEVSRSDN